MSKSSKSAGKGFLIQIAVSLACAYYAFKGIEFSSLWGAVRDYSAGSMLLVLLVSFSSYLALGLRLRYMRSPRLPFWDCVKAGLLCLGANNIFPAKAGEIIKAAWLSRRNDFPFAAALGMVFWERFSDVNLLLLLGVWTMWTLGVESGLLMGAFVLAGVWAVLVFARAFPAFFPALFARVGIDRLTGFVGTLQGELNANMTVRRMSWLAASAFLVWTTYAAGGILSYRYVANLDVNLTQGLCIFAISSLGMLLPSTPGAIGVYEASAVLALSWFGVEKEQALGIALFGHALQILPSTLLAGMIFLSDGGADKTQDG